ncbi:NADase-type glycan-binding domain-containing protein [Aquimarina litoralis]|uniref:NADase-type glycan-binding domain-containing protein n=1 Tax=Aquimarina litoralis TaxID=584605 RepID=UPI001C5A1DDD|nr:hypothetical protein [Aquimarina litoralis]MBW1297006.1 hypothetical protein [Aquimarina litoralis]
MNYRFIITVLFVIISNTKSVAQKEKNSIIKATIDSTSLRQMGYFSNEFSSIFEYYQSELKDELSVWSEKMFGSAQGVDITYAQLLNFNFSSNYKNKNYPIKNLKDFSYLSAYVFKENQEVLIDITINKGPNILGDYNTVKLHPDNVLKSTDTIMFPLQLSLVNGYTKSKSLFYKNGRVKELKVLVNDKTVGYVELLDTPLIQQFSIQTLYTKDDKITLKPLTFYKGTKYDDICISEIQRCLGEIAHPSINEKYKVRELEKR